MGDQDKDLRNAVKNAKSAFYQFKSKKKKETRKEIRRANRILKKTNQHKFHLKKYHAESPNDLPIKNDITKRKRKRKKKKKTIETNDESMSFDKASYEAANKIDEKIISSLGKKLSGNKKKDHLPSIFKQDGLDYILEVCEPFTADSKGFSSDEEYLASKTKRKKTVGSKSDTANMSHNDISNKLLFEDGKESEDDVEFKEIEEEREVDEGDECDKDFADLSEDDEEESAENISGSEDENCRNGEDVVDNDLEVEEVNGSSCEENDQNKDEISPGISGYHKNSSQSNKYIPPALRHLHTDKIDTQKMNETRIRKKLKGLLNRLSDATIPGIVTEIESMYFENSRNFMNETLYAMISEACMSTIATPEKLVIQNMVIVSALQLLTGSEVGSYFLQMLAERFAKIHSESPSDGQCKTCHNVLLMLVSLYNLKVVHCLLIYDLLRACLETFNEQDIRLIFLVIRSCGPDLRKDDPGALKDLIVTFRAKCAELKTEDKSYVNFILEAVDALKNNNIRKIPLYDATIAEDARKCLKGVLQGKGKTSQLLLKVSLNDLLDAEEKGRWWITGSAWVGRGPIEDKSSVSDNPNEMDFNATVLKAAKKQRMNTNVRKQIFCVMLSSDDYIDAFEKLLKLNLKEKQSREIIHVLVDCCLQERSYNPFYSHLANKLCDFNKSNVVTLQYSLWDRFKTISTMKKYSLCNLEKFLAHMIASKSLSLSVLKVITFGALDKVSINFFSRFFTTFLLQYPQNSIKCAFQRISNMPNLSLLRSGIKLFLRHFLYPDDDKEHNQIDISKEKMKELVEIAESALDGCDYVPL